MEVVIDFKYLRGRQNEIVVKEASVAGEGLGEIFRFERPYYMAPHGAVENWLNWDNGHIAYHKLSAVLKEAVAGFPTSTTSAPQNADSSPHCWCTRYSICRTSSVLRQRNPSPDIAAPCPVTDIPTSVTHSLYAWLIYHLQTKFYVTSPADMSRHTSQFISAIGKPSHSDWSIDRIMLNALLS